MNIEPKILVAIPYHKEKKYCLAHLLKIIEEFSYKNIEVVMRWDISQYGGRDNVKRQREFFRQMVLKDDSFTHLYFLGADTIPPADALERLLIHDKDIVGGVYWGRHNAPLGSSEGAVAWINTMSQEDQSKTFLNENSLIEIDGMGMDCVLFTRAVLEKVSWLSWEQNDDDYPYYDKAKENGFNCYIDTSIQCKHYFNSCGYAYLGKVFFK